MELTTTVAGTSAFKADFLMTITDDEFENLRRLIHQRFGINLTEQKRSLLVGRLQKLVRQAGFTTFKQYYEHLMGDSNDKALGQLIDHISTNHTFFNRESDHFEFFSQTALPETLARLRAQGRRDLRIWCAGCSSGEEAYMLLMLMAEACGGKPEGWESGILATDISERVLASAQQGIYSSERIAALPEKLRRKYLVPHGPDSLRFHDSLRQQATFRRFNLMNPFPFKKPFQIIFCRNVMIYFDQPTREALVRKFHQFLEPGGYLFIGHSESLGRSHTQFRYRLPAVYQKENPA
jgi:chemotaxis protein methyltransferase CheR